MQAPVPMLPVSGMPAGLDYYRQPGFGVESRNDDRGFAVPEPVTTFQGLSEFRLPDPGGRQLWIGQKRGDAEHTEGA